LDISEAKARVAGCHLVPWAGIAWRVHNPANDPLIPGDASGRFNRGPYDVAAGEASWLALYLSDSEVVAAYEYIRTLKRTLGARLASLQELAASEVEVDLQKVLVLTDPQVIGMTEAQLLLEVDFSGPIPVDPQLIALAAREKGAEAIIAPSATRRGQNIILFPDIAAHDRYKLVQTYRIPMPP
jgi:hypothetical protein